MNHSLPGAVRRFESRAWTTSDWITVRKHLIAESVRHPDFERAAIGYRAARGNPITNRDEVQDERLVTLANTPSLLARARFAILRTPEDGNRFVINDKGYATVEDVELSQKGVLFPLSGVAAILGVFEAGVVTGRVDAWLCADLTLTPGAVETWNLASWQHKETLCIIGHPSDKERMARLDARSLMRPWLGPYRRRGKEGPFEWAYADNATTELIAPGGP